MESYSEIKNHCEANSELSRAVIDNFLIQYTARKEGIVSRMEASLKKYKRVARKIDGSYINFLKSEYIAHSIFRENGFLSKYLSRPEFRNLPAEQYRYLEFHSKNPWRFSFAQIVSRREEHFFEMEDVMTGETYLLYSPGMADTDKKIHPRLWFNLISYNGKCWQTFGLIIPFKGFTPDDIFFFATEVNPRVEDETMLMKEVERNPFPFFMLHSASNIPPVFSKEHEVVICQSTDSVENFFPDKLSEAFKVEWNQYVYRLTLKSMAEFPHLAMAFYLEQTKELIRTAMTETGFAELNSALSSAGISLPGELDLAVSPAMVATTENILNKKIKLNPYEKLFDNPADEAESEGLENLNRFLELALPYLNSGNEPDLEQLAKKAGIEEETAVSLWEQVKGKFK